MVMMTTPIMRTSERRDLKRCPQRWWWSWREGLKPKGSESTPLWFGTGVHLAFAEWYLPGTKRGPHPAETFAKYAEGSIASIKVADATEEQVAKWEDASVLGAVLMDEYVKTYGKDESWHFIQAEQAFDLLVPWPEQELYIVEPGQPLVRYCGTYDGVYRDLVDGKIKLLETKTAKAIMLDHLTLDDQAGSYYALAARTLKARGLIDPKERLHGITYNFVRKAMPDDRPRDAEGYYTNKPKKEDYIRVLNEQVANDGFHEVNPKCTLLQLEEMAREAKVTVLGERSKSQPPPLFHREPVHRTSREQNSQLKRIQDEAVVMQAFRDGLLPLTKNPTKDCKWDCSFFAMCELHERGGDWEDFKRMAFKQEDPYVDHRKSSDE